VRQSLRGVDTVVHLAATIRDQPPKRIEELNGLATVRLLRGAERSGIERFHFFSALDAYAAQRLAHQVRVRHLAEVSERDLDVDPVLAEPPRLPHQAAHVLAALEQQRQQPRSDASGGPRQQQH
jgi:nucleoside-diphosphate-sugar epimerase